MIPLPGGPDLLRILFRPRAVALVGATSREGSVGRAVLENLMRGYRGRLHPVNPKAGEILGLKAFPGLRDCPEPVDLAVVAVPAPAVPGVLEECARAGVGGAVVLSAGFKECGPEGAALEEILRKVSAEAGIPVLGPNVLGLLNSDPETGLNATFARRVPGPGAVSFLSQSGALGVLALEHAAGHDFGLRLFASLGNKAVLHENHLLDAFAADEGTRVILAYLEDMKDPGPFLEKACALARGTPPKPVILLTGGTGRSGRRAAASHTGALAEKADFLGDLCAQYGVLRASCLEEMFDLAAYFSEQACPRGPRLGIVTNAGGPAILAADEAERQGLVLPEPSPALRAALAAGLPAAAGLGNPVDVLGDSDTARYRHALDTLCASGEYDAVLAVCTPQRMTPMADIAAAVAGAAPGARAAGTVLVSNLAAYGEESAPDGTLALARVPAYAFAEEAARSLGAAWRLARRTSGDRHYPRPQGNGREAAKAVLDKARREGRSRLTGPEAETLLRAYGMPVVPGEVAWSGQDLRKAARAAGFPLAAKIVSPDILHKVDAGGVITGIGSEEELDRAYRDLVANARRYRPDADIRGVQLQAMVKGGVEFLIGAQRHPHFGVLLLFGLGGTWVEALADVRFRRAPLAEHDAQEMIRGIRASALLDGFRGRPARDIRALEDCLFRLSSLMEDLPELTEVDLNPVFSLPEGALIADARMILAG